MLSNISATGFDIAARVSGARATPARALRDRLRATLCGALPQRCVLCCAASGNRLVCADCDAEMPRIDDACPRCALASPQNAVCGACLAKPPPFDATLAAWRYAFPADRLLQSLKYSGMLALAEPLALAVAQAVRRGGVPLPDCLVAMPLSTERQRARGFNHAHEIGRNLVREIAVPLAEGLRRTRHAPPQAGLTLRERTRNVRDAFAADRRLAGRAVAIVDDVMTSGATLRAAATAIRRAGAVRVDAWVVARTPPP